MSETKSGSRGASYGTVLSLMTLVFILLKSFGVVDWDWVYVFIPMFVYVGYVAGLIILAGILFTVAFIFGAIASKLDD